MKVTKYISVLFLLLFLFSCDKSAPFDKNRWRRKIDLCYPHRKSMVNDLIKKKLLVGLSYSAVIKLLGKADIDEIKRKRTIYYEISVEYSGIDPVSSKYLKIRFDAKMKVARFKIYVWKKG